MAEKSFIVNRDPDGDWYKKAQQFLSLNGKGTLEVSIKPETGDKFKEAVNNLKKFTGDNIVFDEDSPIMVITALEKKLDGMASSICQCQCGAAYSCGGGGGGH